MKVCFDIKKMNLYYGNFHALKNIDLDLYKGEVTAFIGPSGCGKSTFIKSLNRMNDLIEYCKIKGKILFRDKNIYSKDCDVNLLRKKVGMVFQKPNPFAMSIYDNIAFGAKTHGTKDKAKLDEIVETSLKKAALWEDLKDRLKHSALGLSGGQQKRVALANILINEPDMLILDEPTNHLDIEMTEWLEGFIGRGNKTLLMVTHDRFFLDRVCSIILELDDFTIYKYKGNYSYYLEKRQERIDNMRTEVQRANNLYKRELEWMRRMPQARGHKAKYREDAFVELEKVAKRKIEERQLRLKSSNVYIGSKIFECQYVSKAFDDKVILKDFYYNFARYEKMGIVGDNGAGKSTFIKLLLGKIQPDSGKFDIGETVKFGYFSQEGLKFNEEQKVIDVITNIADYIDVGGKKHLSASQFLQYFLFTPEQQHNYVYKLSGGEKRKLYLCTILMANPNFLVLDEPTNDLDIQTLQVLEEYLVDFPGCVIVVSHDRYFLDKTVDHLLVFKGNGEIKDFPGNYTQYRDWNSIITSEEREKKEKEKKVTVPSKHKESQQGGKRKMTYKEKCKYEQLEKEITELEKEQRHIEEALNSGSLTVDELTNKSIRFSEIKQIIDQKSLEWLELAEIEG